VEFLGEDKSLSRTADTAEGRMGRLGGTIAKVGKLAAVGAAAGFAVAGVALFKMAQGAAEDAAGQARLAKALKNSTGATDAQVAKVEDWISAQGKALGVADDQLRPALEKLAGATKNVGQAQRLTSLAMDVSAGTGKSLEQVSNALMKAQNGQVAGLSKLGISTKDAAGKTIDFEEAQKRLAALHKGQAATNANTLEGKIGRLKLILSETGETIGSKLLPVATELADWFLNEGLPKIEAFGNYLSQTLPPVFERIKQVVSTVLGALRGDVGSNFDGIKAIFTDAVSIITTLWNTFGSTMVSYLQSTFENFKTIISGAFTVIQGIFQTVSSLLKGDWSGVWDGIKQILSGALDILQGLVGQLWNTIKTAFTSGGIALRGIFSGLWDGIKDLASSGVSWVVDQFTALPGRLLSLGGRLLEAGRTLIGKLFEGLGKLGSIGVEMGQNIWEAVKSAINAGIRNVNNILPNKIGIGPASIDLPDNPIPMLARGVSSFPGGYAGVGEHGRELAALPAGSRVYPHHRTEAMYASARRGAESASGSMPPIIIQGALDPIAVGQQVEKVLIEYARSIGRPLQLQVGA
jgi:hypothetical protein